MEDGAQTTSRDAVLKDVPNQYAAGTGLVLVRPNADYIKAEADYYKANISKVKSITDLMANPRLLSFAMAAHGLDAATETPKRIREMLAGGIQDPQSPANQLTDKRYANFVAAFDFEQYGALATSRDGALKETPALYVGKSTAGFIKPSAEYVKAETAYYLANVSKLEFDRRSDGRQAAAELRPVVIRARPGDREARRRPQDAGGRHRRSGEPGKQADGQALRGLRVGLQLRRTRREGHDLQQRAAAGDRQIHAPDAGGECRQGQ